MILVIEIRGFPGPANREQPNPNAPEPYDPLSIVMQRGWLFQLYAPISTMMGVLGSGQEATNDTELDLLQKYWHEKGIEITTVIFQPDPKDYEKADGPFLSRGICVNKTKISSTRHGLANLKISQIVRRSQTSSFSRKRNSAHSCQAHCEKLAKENKL